MGGWLKDAEREQRKLRIAELLAAQPGISYKLIGEKVGLGHASVAKYVKVIKQEWRERRMELVESKAAEDLARTDAAIGAIWEKVLNGEGWAIDRLMSILNYRAKVLGVEVQKMELDFGAEMAALLQRVAEASEEQPTDGEPDGPQPSTGGR